jgi:hypothetical protein
MATSIRTGRWSDAQVVEVIEARLKGATSGQIARQLGVSVETLRPLIRELELPSCGRCRARIRARRIRAELGKAGSIEELARLAGVSYREVHSELSASEKAALREPRRPHRRYQTDELVELLREAAAASAPKPLSSNAFTAYGHHAGLRLADGRPWPTHQTMINRFGSWSAALKRAGLRPARANNGHRCDRVSGERCLEALNQAWRLLAGVPTVEAYEELVHSRRLDGPSPTTIRHRFGSWNAAISQAARRRERVNGSRLARV